MAIQVRRGNESDFDASKMLPGEWAVSLDTRYVRMCFAPGIVLRMSTYDAFEADMAQIQAILAECRNIQSAVQRIQTEVNTKASLTVEYANDAKESADRAYSEAERAKTYADNAEAVTGVQIATKDRAGLIKGGNNHIAEDGTLMLITTTDSTTQPNSYAGRENILEIGGVTEQGENPSPTNPQEIKNSAVSGVKTHWKNFLKNTATTQTANGVTFTVNDDKSVTVNGTASADTSILLNGGAHFDSGTYSFFNNSSSASTYYMVVTNSSSAVAFDYNSTFTLTEPKTLNTYITVKKGANVSNITFYPMIREASITDDTYEPYTESSHTFSQPIELYGMNGVQDVIEDGAIKRKYKKIILDGSDDEKWGFAGSLANPLTFYCEISDAKRSLTTQNGLCDTYTFVEKNFALLDDNECTMYQDYGNNYPNSNWIYIRDTSCETVMELKTRLQSAPITVIYELATPTTEALPIADQIGLNSLQTYDGITYVEFIYDELEPTFKGKYGTSEVGGYTLESLLTARNNELKQNMVNERLSALEASVVNNI